MWMQDVDEDEINKSGVEWGGVGGWDERTKKRRGRGGRNGKMMQMHAKNSDGFLASGAPKGRVTNVVEDGLLCSALALPCTLSLLHPQTEVSHLPGLSLFPPLLPTFHPATNLAIIPFLSCIFFFPSIAKQNRRCNVVEQQQIEAKHGADGC